MAKRKRDTNEPNEEIIVDQKSKQVHKHQITKHGTSSSTATSHDKLSAVRALNTQLNTTAVNTATAGLGSGITGSRTDLPEAPPGLSKGARKRWRKRQKLAAAKASQPQLEQVQTSSKHVAPAHMMPQESKQRAKSMLKESSLRDFGTTQLMPGRQKVWHKEAPNQAKRLEDASTTDSPKRQHATAGVKISFGHDKGADRTRSKQTASASDTDGDDSSSSHSSATSAKSGPEKSTKETLDRSVKDQELPNSTEGIDGARSLAPPATTAAVRRTSFGFRATSVPSFSNSSDPVESFRRFSAWLHKGDSDSEDSESEDAESDIQNSGESVPNDGVVELSLQVAAALEDHSRNRDESRGITLSTDVVRPMSSEEVDIDQLPRFSDPVASLTPANGSTWPANVGIKRQMSFLGQEPGGIPSGSGVGPDSEVNRSFHSATTSVPSNPFEIRDDSQELLRTVDEISNTVFGSTRPLPASKKRRSLDPGNAAAENGFLTSASSDRRMTRAMDTPKGSQEQGAGGNEGLRLLSIDPTTVQSQSTTWDEPTYEPLRDEGQASPDSMGSNIDVIKLDPKREVSGATTSTSSLSELSRSPSPPPEAALLSSILQKLAEPNKQDQLPNTNLGPDTDEIVVLPRKKRKMTGRTSKHFSTPKKAIRQRNPSAQELGDVNELPDGVDLDAGVETAINVNIPSAQIPDRTGTKKPKSRTNTSKVEDSQQDETANVEVGENATALHTIITEQSQTVEEPPPAHSTRSSTKKRKSTGKKSSYFTPSKPPLDPEIIDRVDFYNTTASAKKARVPAGTSIAPMPPTTAERFGIIQEKLWREPFWLLIAVTFLNKTTGRAAVPVFWALKERYATPEALAKAEQDELCEMIHHLGLQNQRAKRLISMAQAWAEEVPVKAKRGRTLHYPAKDNGREYKRGEIVEEDADDCAGALEVAHIPGCGPYAWDSWRIFCRDILRGVAGDYNGAGATDDFVPEWKKVLPGDKELRACLRWMWLREGWIWDHETGETRRAIEVEMQKAFQGEMEIDDPQERKFAAQAAGFEVSPTKSEADQVDASVSKEIEYDTEAPSIAKDTRPRTPEPPQTAEDDGEGDNIVVTPVVSPATRKWRHRPSLRG